MIQKDRGQEIKIDSRIENRYFVRKIDSMLERQMIEKIDNRKDR